MNSANLEKKTSRNDYEWAIQYLFHYRPQTGKTNVSLNYD